MSSSVCCLARMDAGLFGLRCPVGALRNGVALARRERDEGQERGIDRRIDSTTVERRGHPTGFRVILTTGLVALYLAGCLAALALLAQIWAPSL